MDPRDIHWAIPLMLRREEPAVRDMPGADDEVIVMVRGELIGWYLRKHRKLPPVPPEASGPRTS
jgi:hypothetical protein